MAPHSRISKLSRSVEGKAVLITGAGSGIGRATAHLFADEGARVAVTDVNAGSAKSVADEIRAAGGAAVDFGLDVANGAQVGAVIAEVAEAFGGLDVLVNNAGISVHSAIDAPGFEASWAKALDVLLTAQTRTIRAALPYLRKAGGGRIINLASTEGLGATPAISPYTAAKHGVIGLTRALAVELGKEGITVNCVCPGPIRTGMTAPIPDEAKAKFARRRVPLARYGEPEEIAHGILSLALPGSSYINGVVLVIDGGMTIKNA
jgi:3-oxoacyl-[acyl-carrier protein] reductase